MPWRVRILVQMHDLHRSHRRRSPGHPALRLLLPLDRRFWNGATLLLIRSRSCSACVRACVSAPSQFVHARARAWGGGLYVFWVEGFVYNPTL